MSKKIVLIVDAGHGGNHPVTGQYLTPPHIGKFYRFLDENGKLDFEIREGVINRLIADRLVEVATQAGFEVAKVYHYCNDNSLAERCAQANVLHQRALAKGQRSIFLSFHSDASGMKSEGQGERPRGISFWTSRGKTLADQIATIWHEEVKKGVLGSTFRDKVLHRVDMSDGDIDWEADFYVLKATAMPAVLVENLFFTNREDAKCFLMKITESFSCRPHSKWHSG